MERKQLVEILKLPDEDTQKDIDTLLKHINFNEEKVLSEFKKRLIKKANEERKEFRDEYYDRVDYISICDLEKLINNLK